VTGNATVVNTATVAQIVGCSGPNSTQVLSCLRQVPMETLLKAEIEFNNMTVQKGGSQDNFFATVDGTFLIDAPSKLLRSGQFHKKISVITGFNENDGSIFVPPTLNSSESVLGYLHISYPTLSQKTLSTLVSLYPLQSFLQQAQQLGASPYFLQASLIYRDVNFACQSIETAYHIEQYGSSSWLYVLDSSPYTSVLQLFNASFFGVIHSSDIPFVFNQPNLGFGTTAANNLTASRMSGSWVKFASTGDPAGKAAGTLAGWTQASVKAQTNPAGLNVTSASIRVIGGQTAGQAQLKENGGAEPGLLERCAFINTKDFYRQLQT
jgi:carboxylesterase type B